MGIIRHVIYDYTFEEQAKLVERDTKRLDEIIRGAEWLISRHAESCQIVDGNLRVAFTQNFPDAPEMRIFFTITDANTCTAHWIETVDSLDDESMGF